MNRVTRYTLQSVALGASLALAGCFNNISGVDGSMSAKQSNGGSTLNDSGFANETGAIDTTAVLIGTYNDTAGSGFGIMIDLQKSLTNTLGADSIQTILNGIDTNSAMQARSVVIHLPAFGIKATTTLGKIAAGNTKKLRNVMNIRPRLKRIDLASSALDVPGSPAVLQLRNANSTVITYGGMIEGDYIRRMTVLIPFAGVTGMMLPSTSAPTYGDGFPAASPQETAGAVRLVRVTSDIAAFFGRILTANPYGPSLQQSVQSDAIRTIVQTKDSLALAVHYKTDATGAIMTDTQANLMAIGLPGGNAITTTGVPLIDAAYFININPAVTSGPETFAFCNSGYDRQDQTSTWGADANGNALGTIDYSNALSCHCTAAQAIPAKAGNVAPNQAQFMDPCGSIGTAASNQPTYTVAYKQKKDLIADAVAAEPAAPTSGVIILASPITLNNFLIEQE